MTTNSSLCLPITYFGKLPTEGDFLKGTENRALIAVLDQWATEGLKLLSEDVAWKMVYDQAQAVNFVFMSTRRQTVVGGIVLPSHDATGRRFPFLSAVTYEADTSPGFVAYVPHAMSRLWARLNREVSEARTSTDPSPILEAFVTSPVTLTVGQEVLRPIFDDFLDSQSIGSLQDMLNASGHQVDVRRILVSLGILMKPVRALDTHRMVRGLRFPLPCDPLYRQLVSAFWINLVSGFIGQINFDLMVLQRTGPAPMMTLGFRGMTGDGMHGIFDPRVEANNTVLLDDPAWVEEQIQQQYLLKKLSTYASQSDLSLRTATTTFVETFLGA